MLLALPDRPEFAEAFWGAMKIGAVPVADGLPADELASLLQDSRARAVIAFAPAAAAAILEVRGRCPALRTVIAVGGRRRGALSTSGCSRGPRPERPASDASRDDAALWLYTSGSPAVAPEPSFTAPTSGWTGPTQSEDGMKRLASRLTWWQEPHKSTSRSTPQKGEASHGPYWHRRAQEGKPDLSGDRHAS